MHGYKHSFKAQTAFRLCVFGFLERILRRSMAGAEVNAPPWWHEPMTCAYCFCTCECHVVTGACVRVTIEDAGARSAVGTENVSYSVIRNARWDLALQAFAEFSSQAAHFVFQMILTLSVMAMTRGMINPWGLLK